MRIRLLVGSAVVLLGLLGLPASPALAAYAGGSVGHDVSYPQCSPSGSSTTSVSGLGGAFGIVGVNGGRPWAANSCSGAEYAWAAGLSAPPALYMNTANPAPASSYYWPVSGSRDPALCSNAASTSDPGCAYDYGWHAAANALQTLATGLPGAATDNWWLDVETANSWNGDGTSNAADLQGAIDFLRSHGVPSVGLYSTAAQWTSITGGYNTSNAATYTAAWAPEFAAQYPMTNSPVWVAGAGDQAAASTACGTSFTGGPTQLAQFSDGSGYDADLACGPAAPSVPTPPQSLTATAANAAVTLRWSPPASNGGASVTYAVYRGTTSGGESAAPIANGLTATSYTSTGLANGTKYYYTVKASNSSGASGPSNEASATPKAPSPTFSLSLSPTSAAVRRGSAANAAVKLTETGGTQRVAFAATHVPTAVKVSFSPSSLTASGSATMKVTVGTTAKTGTYRITVTASGASGIKGATYALTVR